MDVRFFFLLIFTSNVLGANVLSLLPTYLELSTFNFYVNASANLTNLLSTANNFTLLAPSNTAFDNWFSSQEASSLSDDVIEATLFYHVLQGGFPSSSFSDEPQFVASQLANSTYSNVTGGQRVELVAGPGGQAEFISDNQTVTTILSPDILCNGGLFHIVDSVLGVPLPLIKEMAEARWGFFIGIINKGGYLTEQDHTLVVNALLQKDMTYFAPNTAEALAYFTNLTAGSSQSDLAAVFNYHVIPGIVAYSTLLETGRELQTLQGDNVTITIVGSDTFVNGAKIIEPDFLIANGVVHLIDSVLDRFNTSLPNTGSSKVASASGGSLPTAAKIGIVMGVVFAFTFIVTAALVFFVRLLRRRKASNGQLGPRIRQHPPTGELPPVYFSKRRTMSNRLSRVKTGSYLRQIESRGTAKQALGQDFELDANQVSNKAVKVMSPVELDAGSYGMPQYNSLKE